MKLGGYRDQIAGADAGRSMSGSHLSDTALSMGYQILLPGGDCIVRVIPEYSDGRVYPCRIQPGDCEFTGFIVALQVWIGGLSGTTSFICQVPTEDRTGLYRTTQVQPPPDMFYERLRRLAKNDPRFHGCLPWFERTQGRSPILSQSQRRAYMHVIALKAGKKPFPNGAYRQVLLLPKSAREAVENLCNEQTKGYAGNPEDLSARYVAGDWLDPAKGKLLHLYSTGGDAEPASFGVPKSFDQNAIHSRPDRGRMDIERYVADISQPSPPLTAEQISQLFLPWEKTLRFYDPEEQVALLARVFPIDVVRFIFSDTPWLPQSLRTGRAIHAPGAALQPPMPASTTVESGALSSQPPRSADQFQFSVPSFEGTVPAELPIGDVLPTGNIRPDAPPSGTVVPDTTVPAAGAASADEQLRRLRAAAQNVSSIKA